MPTYDFRCSNGHNFEHFFKSMNDAPMTFPCPTCGESAERRISGGAGLMFKGSGFYLTDYGKNAHRGGSSDSNNKKDGGSSTESGSAREGSGSSKESGGSSSSGGDAPATKPDAPASKPAESKSAESKPSKSSD